VHPVNAEALRGDGAGAFTMPYAHVTSGREGLELGKCDFCLPVLCLWRLARCVVLLTVLCCLLYLRRSDKIDLSVP
jgi:hypothetical protein